MSWEKVKLGEIAEFSNGVNFDKSAYAPGIKLISVSNFGNRFYPDYSELSEISADAVKKNDYLQHGDIVFVRSNGNKELVGRCMLIDNPPTHTTYSGFCIRARVKDTTRFNPKFLTYHFKHDGFRIAMAGNAVGANIQNLSQGRLSAYIVYIPPIETQRRIADILSAYDDLIGNNRKQIKLLEEAAQRLYKEWFVDLHFPGHEHTKIVDGVPEGWKKERLVDIADVQYGYAFDGALFNSKKSGTPIIRIRNIPESQTEDYTTEAADSQYLVYNGDIVVGMDGDFHINSWAGDTAYLVQRTCRIKPLNSDLNGFLLWAIYEPIKYFERTVVGATVAHLGKKHIDTIQILVPTEKFYLPFKALFDKRLLLLNQNKKLAEARDRLLPKLMSGKVEV